MRHPRRSRSAIWAAVLCPLLLGAAQAAGPAHAEEELRTAASQQPAEPFSTFDRSSRLALHGSGEPRRTPRPWLVENIHIKKGAGFEFSRPLKMGERKMEFGVQGPVMRKKNLGLSFELRF